MEGKEGNDPAGTEFKSDSNSSWTLAGPDSVSDSVTNYFLDRESSILSEFGWNILQPDHADEFDRFSELDRTDARPDLAGNFSGLSKSCGEAGGGSCSGTASNPNGPAEVPTSNPLVSSSSSEDPPEKSTDFGGKPPEIPSKVRKKGQKRVRQARFAFMTKSEVDHLEDGYRWRKYGQKAVKNSPFPRSYYRCTNGKCTVKKRVERSCEDPTIVITTYEGQHCHHSVGFPRGGFIRHEVAFARQFNPKKNLVRCQNQPHSCPKMKGYLGISCLLECVTDENIHIWLDEPKVTDLALRIGSRGCQGNSSSFSRSK